MTTFNPQISPTQDPNYLNYARSIDAPAPNQSGKIALETAGTAIEGATTIADTAIKENIKRTAFAKADEKRDAYTAGLENIKSDLDKGVIPQAAQGKVGGSLIDNTGDDVELPAGLESGLNRIQQLALAKQSGSARLNDTQYAKDSLSIAKNLRNTYGEGYREFIDQKVSEATGLPVANSYYQNMLTDINRQLNQIGKTKDEVGKLMYQNLAVPGMAKMIELRQKGDPRMTDSYIIGRIADQQNLESQIKIDAAKRAEKKDLDADHVQDETRSHVDQLSNAVRMEMSSVKDMGVGSSGKDLINYFNDVSQGKIQQTEAEVQQKKLVFNAWVAQVQQKVSDMTNIAGPDGRTKMAAIGADTFQQNVKNAMFPIYAMQSFVNSKEDGPAFYVSHQIDAIQKGAAYGFLINKDSGKEAAQLMGARQIFGDQYFPDYIRSLLEKGVDLKFADPFRQEAMAAVQPYTDTRGQPIPRYMKDAIQHGKEIGATSESNYFSEVTKLPLKIADPNMPLAAKDAMINWAFNPKGNAKVLDELKMDYRDPNSGEWVPGKYRAFNILASDGVAKGVASTAIVHPQNYVNYRNTLESEFGRLYRSDVVTLNKVFEGTVVPTGPDGRPVSGLVSTDTKVNNKIVNNTGISWDNERNTFGLVDKQNRPINRQNLSVHNPNYAAYSGLLDTFDKVNSGIGNLANVQKNDPLHPGDIGKYLLQTLQTVGLRPNGVSGATEGMIKALIKAKSPDMTNDEVNNLLKRNFQAEPDTSVSGFIRNPTGVSLPQAPRPARGSIRGNLSDQPENAPIRTY